MKKMFSLVEELFVCIEKYPAPAITLSEGNHGQTHAGNRLHKM